MVVSCGTEEAQQPAGENWGHTEYYEDFLCWNYKPVVMSQKLDFEMNKDALYMLNKDGEKQGSVTFCVSSSKKEFVEPHDIVVYFNGKKSKDCTFTFTPKVNEDSASKDLEDDGFVTVSFDLGIEFKDNASEGEHIYYILYGGECTPAQNKTQKSGNRIYAKMLQVDTSTLSTVGIYTTKEVITNTAKIIFCSIVLTILGVFIAALIISRMTAPKIGVRRIVITGAYHKQLSNVHGKQKVVLTAVRKKQGFMNKLFRGTILYEVHPSWTSDVTFEARNKNSVRLKYNANDYMCDSLYLEKNNNYTLVNSVTREKTEITVR